MIWILGLRPDRSFAVLAWSWRPLDLKLGHFPQPMYPLSIDLAHASEHGPCPPVAIAGIAVCKRREFAEQLVIVRGSLLIVKCCALQLSQVTRAANRASILY
jgi:hypothetical protein